jgi:molybdenum cofactor cytidylyltransferase
MSPAEGKSGSGVGAVILAAGESRRMGDVNKLCLPVDGKPMLLHAVEAVVDAGIEKIWVVTGHESSRIRALLKDYPVGFIHNEDYGDGLSTSLRAGIEALDADLAGALICLGDMPRIRPSHIQLLVKNFDPDGPTPICVPVHGKSRGHPVLWPRRYFADIRRLEGDVGARHLLDRYRSRIKPVNVSDDGVLFDIDSPEVLEGRRALRAKSSLE